MSDDAQNVNPIIGIEKKCTKCKTIKPLNGFSKDARLLSGRKSRCKKCRNKESRIWKENNKEKCDKYNKIWKLRNSDKIKKASRIWRNNNKEKFITAIKTWAKNNPDKIRILNKRKYEKRREKLGLISKKRHYKNQYIFHRLNRNMASGIRKSLHNNKNGRHWEDLVGYSWVQLKKHLEKQFKDGMTWENYGEWHIDHIIPKSIFNFTKPEDYDFKRCWSLKNLRPLWAIENMSKFTKLETHFQPSLF